MHNVEKENFLYFPPTPFPISQPDKPLIPNVRNAIFHLPLARSTLHEKSTLFIPHNFEKQ